MPLTRREKAGYATVGTGGALVYGSAQLNERGINNALKLTGKERKTLPGLRAWHATKDVKGRGIPRLQMAGGNVGRAIGTAGVIGGLAQAQQGRKWRRDNPNNKIIKGYVREGFKGNVTAVKERGENLKEGKPVGAAAIAAGIGTAGSSLGSLAVHRKLDKTKKAKAGLRLKNRPGLVAMGGLAGLGLSAPISNQVVQRKYPEYKVTAAGVQRKKTAPVRPSSVAAHFDQKKLGRSGFRRQTVPGEFSKMGEALGARYTSSMLRLGERFAPKVTLSKDPSKIVRQQKKNASGTRKLARGSLQRVSTDPTPLLRPLEELAKGFTDKQKRATVMAAGAVPIVGDFAAAGAAGRVANPENRKKAVATQLAGNLGGSAAGGVVGAAAAGEMARRNPKVKAYLEAKNAALDAKKTQLLKPVTDRLPKRAVSKPGAAGAAKSVLSSLKPKIPGRYAGLGGALAVGGMAGNVLGGQAAGYKATSVNLDRDRKTVAKALVIVNQGQKVDREANELAARRKKRSARLSTMGGTLGVTGFGMMAAAKKPSVAAKFPKLADQARDVGLAGGGIGGANALYYARVQRKEAKALTAQRSTPTREKVYKADAPKGAGVGTYLNALGLHAGSGGVRREVVRSMVKGPPKEMPSDHRTYHQRALAGEKVPRRYRIKEEKPRGRLMPVMRRAAVAKAMPGSPDLVVPRAMKALRPPKPMAPPKPEMPSYRRSALVRRREPGGTLVSSRRKASVG